MLSEGPLGYAYFDILTRFIKATVPIGELASIADLLIHHQIVTTRAPAFSQPRRLAEERLKVAKKEFDLLRSCPFAWDIASCVDPDVNLKPTQSQSAKNLTLYEMYGFTSMHIFVSYLRFILC